MGRSIDNDVRFLVSEVSRHHCTIEIEIDQTHKKAFLQVLGASGVLLNGILLLPASEDSAGRYQLSSGDSIVIARRSFTFELPDTSSVISSEPHLFASPAKASQAVGSGKTRRVRMSLVNSAQIDTPARRSPLKAKFSPAKSPGKASLDRDARRVAGLNKFMLSAKLDSGNAKGGRKSLSSSTANPFVTPSKAAAAPLDMPKTAPPKQVSFSLYSNSHSKPLSPVKQMCMMPPLDTMLEEQDLSFGSQPADSEQIGDHDAVEVSAEDDQEADPAEDIVVMEELELQDSSDATEERETAQLEENNAAKSDAELAVPSPAKEEPTSPSTSSTSGSPKRAKRRSSFFGRAGPFRGISLGFYAEERQDPAPTPAEQPAPSADVDDEDVFTDAPVAEVETVVQAESPPQRPRVYGISKTPSPTKKSHFVGLTPLPRKPRLSLTTLRRVSLRTQTLLRSSEAYADRLYLPPPPSALRESSSFMTKSSSMPSNLSQHSLSSLAEQHVEEEQETEPAPETSFEEPAQHEEGEEPCKDTEEDEDEVDKSLSLLESPTRRQYNSSPVKLPQFATPQPSSKKSRSGRRASLPSALPVVVGTPALVSLQINGSGERILVSSSSERSEPSPVKSKKLIRVSDVGLPSTEVSMGYDLVAQSDVQQEGEQIAEALNELFNAEQDEMTDDEDEAEADDDESVVRVRASPAKPSVSTAVQPQTPAAFDTLRHLFSAPAAPNTPDMQGLGTMLGESPSKSSPSKPQYGTLYDRMRANPEMAQLMSSPTKPATSPRKPRSSVRRSQAAESPARSATTRSVASTPRPAFEAELHVTLFDTSVIDAQNEAMMAQSQEDAENEAVATQDNVETIQAVNDAEALTGEVETPAVTHAEAEIEQVASRPNDPAPEADSVPASGAEVSASDTNVSSPSKATRKGPKKAKATETVVASEAEDTATDSGKSARGRKPRSAAVPTLVNAEEGAVSTPAAKKTRAPRGKKMKDNVETEDEAAAATEEAADPPAFIQQDNANAAEPSPVKPARSRAATAKRTTRAKAAVPVEEEEATPAPAPAVARSTRARRGKAAQDEVAPSSDRPEMPSSSAALGDDEASEHEETKDEQVDDETTQTNVAKKRAVRGKTSKVTTATPARDPVPSSSPTKEVAARKPRAKAAASKAKPASRQAETNDDEAAASSASTTRSGRPRRAAAAR